MQAGGAARRLHRRWRRRRCQCRLWHRQRRWHLISQQRRSDQRIYRHSKLSEAQLKKYIFLDHEPRFTYGQELNNTVPVTSIELLSSTTAIVPSMVCRAALASKLRDAGEALYARLVGGDAAGSAPTAAQQASARRRLEGAVLSSPHLIAPAVLPLIDVPIATELLLQPHLLLRCLSISSATGEADCKERRVASPGSSAHWHHQSWHLAVNVNSALAAHAAHVTATPGKAMGKPLRRRLEAVVKTCCLRGSSCGACRIDSTDTTSKPEVVCQFKPYCEQAPRFSNRDVYSAIPSRCPVDGCGEWMWS